MKNAITVSITDFGAKENAQLQTDSIQKAIDYVFQKGGGEVRVPAGEFLTGGIRLRSRVTLHLLENAHLIGSRDWRDYDIFERDTLEPVADTEETHYALNRWNHGLVKAMFAEDVAIIGEKGSLLDGRNCYDPEGEEGFRGPHAVNMAFCRNLTFRGYTIRDSANWAHCILNSVNVEGRDLTVLAGHDGFHVTGCKNVIVEDCVFHTGDDCIAGYAVLNMEVRRCDFNTSCSSLRLGGTNVLVEDCKAWCPSIYGHRYTMTKEEQAAMLPTNETHRHTSLGFLTYLSGKRVPMPATPGNMVIRNCTVDGHDRFYQFNFSGTDKWQVGTGVKNVRFENMKVSNIHMPIVAYAEPELPTILEMRDVEFSFSPDYAYADPVQVGNFERLSFRNVTFKNVRAGHLIKAWGEQGILETENLKVEDEPAELLVPAKEKFYSADV